MRFQRRSIAPLVAVKLVTIISLVLAAVGVATLWSEYDTQHRALGADVSTSANQLSAALSLPLWNFQAPVVNRILDSAMEDDDIAGVIVRQPNVAETGGSSVFVRSRDSSWHSVTRLPSELDLGIASKRPILYNGTQVGSLELIGSSRFTDARIRSSLVLYLAAILLVDFLLVVSLYALLHEEVFHPLRAIEDYASRVSEGENETPVKSNLLFRGELAGLRESVEAMVALQQARYAALAASEAAMLKLNRLYVVLSAINQLIVHERNPTGLLQSACRIASEQGRFRVAWFGMFDENTQIVRPVAWFGMPEGRLGELEIDITKPDKENRPSAVAYLTGQVQVSDDIRTMATTHPWQAIAIEAGCLSSALLPLKVGGKIKGIFCIAAGELNFFDADELRLLKELMNNIGFALDALDAEASAIRYQHDLEQSEQRFQAMYEAAPLGIALKDALSGRYIHANPKFLEIVGLSHEALLTKRWQDLTHVDDLEAEGEQIARFLDGDISGFQIEKRIVISDGSVKWVNLTMASFATPDDAQANYLAMIEDITQRKALQQQLHQAQRIEAVGQLTGGIAHDFNNLLTIVMGNGEALVGSLEDPGLKELASLILHAAERGAELTGQLLAFARQQPLSPRSFDLGDLLGKTEGMIRRTFGSNLEFSIDTPPGLWNAFADPGLTEAAILNLCLNARDAMPEGGKLAIESANARIGKNGALHHPDAKPGDYVEFRISDTGTGIPPDVVARIFEPFFTTKELGRGTGLGLSMVYGFVRQSGGFIDVATQVGEGSTFSIYLPAAAEAAAAPAPAESGPLPCGQERVLLVEDDDMVRSHVHRMVKSLGYEVIEAIDGPSALAALDEHADIDLLLTDLMMPGGMNGRELAEAAVARRPGLPVLFTSGYSSEALTENGRLVEGLMLLSKPYSKRELAEKIRLALDGA